MTGESGATLFPGDADGIGERVAPPACDSGGLASDDSDGFKFIVGRWLVDSAGLPGSDSEAIEDAEVIEAVLPGGADADRRSIVEVSLMIEGEGVFASIGIDTEVSPLGKSGVVLLPCTTSSIGIS